MTHYQILTQEFQKKTCLILKVCLMLISMFFLSHLQQIQASEKQTCRCLPQESCWPSKTEWQTLQKKLTGKLVKPHSLLSICHQQPKSKQCQKLLTKIKNPFVVQSGPGNTMSQGWLNAWNYHNSVYAAEVKNIQDIVTAVNFARQHHLRLVIKGSGHDYLGRSSAANSFLIWTRRMRKVTFHDHFIPQSCPKNTKAQSAITVQAGARWLDAYQMAAKHQRYVQGGGCTTVGAAGGFTQGGGFGSFSKKFGMGSAGVLQATIVTADGKILVANHCQNQDLFWAIRGGGGSTYGVVAQLTLMTHTLPKYDALIHGKINSTNEEKYKLLIAHIVKFYNENMNNPHWGEQIAFNTDNSVNFGMVYQGENQKNLEQIWQKMSTWLAQHHYKNNLQIFSIPPDKLYNYDFWHKHFPSYVKANTAKDAKPGEYWWTPNSNEVHTYWYTYQSWCIPISLFSEKNAPQLTDTIYQASRLGSVVFHFNKGLAGASKDALKRGLTTSVNPVVYDAGALVIMSASNDKVYPGYKGLPQPGASAKEKADAISKAINMFVQLAPDSGTYANEADYFQKNWQQAFWGKNYPQLLKIKLKYDPNGLFYCHHCVGSEYWDKFGMCRKSTVKFN